MEKRRKEITVIDSIMGSGKTQWAIQRMNEASDLESFIYITPFLDEVQRIKDSVDHEVYEPNNANDERRKMRSLKDLIVQGHDIASTHSLFSTADDELVGLLTDAGYTLILDEVMSCVETVGAQKSEIDRLLKSGEIEIKENGKVSWVGDDIDSKDRYVDIYLMANSGSLFYYRGKFLVWTFPPQVFDLMSNVYVMTYLFRGQMQSYYFDLYGFPRDYKAVKSVGEGRYELTEHDIQNENREALYGLMNVYEGKMNDIGRRGNALSVSYLQRKAQKEGNELTNQIQKNLTNYFKNVVNAKREDVYYSTLKMLEPKIQPIGYKEPKKAEGEKGKAPEVVIPHNTRATNQYSHKWALAYVFNRYMVQDIKVFFEANDVSVNDEMLAVSDLLQWIYRSRIRNGEQIELYLPSSRMRKLLKQWANYEV